MPVAQSPAHYINSRKGCPSITESFPLVYLLVLWRGIASGGAPLFPPRLIFAPPSVNSHELSKTILTREDAKEDVVHWRLPPHRLKAGHRDHANLKEKS
jgi:hypothetical protein